MFDCAQIQPITVEDFVNAMRQIRPSVSTNDIQQYVQWNALYGSGGI